VQHDNFKTPKTHTEFRAKKREYYYNKSRKANSQRNVTTAPNKPKGGEGESRERGRWKGKCWKMALQHEREAT
jgi:hypothetical protein